MLRFVRASMFALVIWGVTGSATQGQTAPGRPLILLVHGRGMIGRDTAATRKLWLDGLRSGIATVTKEPTIDDADLRVVWYADVLDPRSDAGCDYGPDDPRTKRDARGDDGVKQLASLAGGFLGALSSMVDDSESATQLRALSGDAAFLSNPRKRCASESRFGDALERARAEGRPVIVVAHSLGSLVAYDYLSARAARGDSAPVARLITLGSMVGSPMVRRLLIGGDSTDVLAKPAGVRTWVNVRNTGDPFAVPLPIADDIVASPPADETDPHEMVGYLRGSAAARQILNGWCEAFGERRPQGCKEVVPK
jgi:hypothetical protein